MKTSNLPEPGPSLTPGVEGIPPLPRRDPIFDFEELRRTKRNHFSYPGRKNGS